MFVSLRQPRCGFWFPFATGLGRLAPKRTPVFLAATLFIGLGSAQTITTQFTARLTESGDNPPLAALVADAQAAPDSLTSALRVTTPNEQAPRLLNLVNPAIAIPFDSKVREIEAFWNGVPLPLIDPSGTLIAQEAHSYGGMIPFFKPLFSVAAIPVGNGTLEIRAFDSAHSQVAAVSITNLTIVRSPPPLDPDVIRGTGHPRIYLGAGRLAAAAGRSADDVARQRFEAALNRFLAVLADIPDVTSAEFENQIYDPEDYIPLLGLAYQLHKDDDSTIAPRAAGAARSLTLRIASDYDTGVRNFGRDTGYDIRFGLRNLMLAYDWLYDEFSPSERDLIVKVATNWIDWYHNTPGYVESWPAENYYAGYLQGITLTAFATAGDNPAAGRFFNLLWSKLLNEVPVMNQYLAGGDWAEGWNYGPYSVTEFALVNTVLRDAGVDWSADFDWLQHLPRSLLYQVAPDFSETRSYGGYSGNYPHKTSPAMLATLSTTTQDNGYADYLYRSMNANPNNETLRFALANVQVSAGRYDDAVATFHKILDDVPNMPPGGKEEVYSRIGAAEKKKGDANAALASFTAANKLMPNDARPIVEIALIYEQSGRLDLARASYENALKLDPENAQAMNNLAYLKAVEQVDLDRALSLAERARQKMPDNVDVQDTLALIYVRKNLTDEALRMTRELVSKQPNNPVYHYHLALALYQKGDKPSAKKELSTALSLRPSAADQNRIRDLMGKIG